MNSLIIAAAFLLMLLSPCLAAQCSSILPIRLRVRKSGTPAAAPKGPSLRLAALNSAGHASATPGSVGSTTPQSAIVPTLPLHGPRRFTATVLRHPIPPVNGVRAESSARTSRAA